MRKGGKSTLQTESPIGALELDLLACCNIFFGGLVMNRVGSQKVKVNFVDGTEVCPKLIVDKSGI